MIGTPRGLATILSTLLVAGAATCQRQQGPPTGSTTVAPGASIGEATMEQDGTIVLTLRAEGPGAARGDAQFRYPPSHPEYREILAHLGGLKPGERKPVPPWEEK